MSPSKVRKKRLGEPCGFEVQDDPQFSVEVFHMRLRHLLISATWSLWASERVTHPQLALSAVLP